MRHILYAYILKTYKMLAKMIVQIVNDPCSSMLVKTFNARW
jgi:hypothetical protein